MTDEEEPEDEPLRPSQEAAEVLPGSDGGLIEAVKRAVIRAFREAFTGTSIVDTTGSRSIHVDFEYPMKEVQYPALWVQFSVTKMVNAGIGQEDVVRTVENEGEDDEWVNWEPVLERYFEGRVSLTIVGLSSLQRDRLADRLVAIYSFSRLPDNIIRDPRRDINQYRVLMKSLAENPYVNININSDVLIAGGQATNVGVPWNPERLAYEDTYSFDVMGHFQMIFRHDGTYTLRRVDFKPEIEDPDGWT